MSLTTVLAFAPNAGAEAAPAGKATSLSTVFQDDDDDDDDDDGAGSANTLPQTGAGTIAPDAGLASGTLLAAVLGLTALGAAYGVRRRLDGVRRRA